MVVPPFRLRPSLVELCVPIIATFPDVLCILASIPSSIRSLVIDHLPVHLHLDLCAQFIVDNEEYWKRRSMLKWETCDLSCHGRSWKQLFFERNLADALENFDPTVEDITELKKLLDTSKPFVHNLVVCQLPSHLNPALILHSLGRQLTSLKLEYGWRKAKMNYHPEKFGMKISDCLAFSASLSISTTLTDLDLSFNLLDDEKTKILLKGMMRNPILLQVNFSHNRIGDAGITELAQYLVSEVCFLVGVKLSNNYFSTQGAKALAEALKSNGVLTYMDLGYNKLEDEGGCAIIDSLLLNTSLQKLVLGNCRLGEETATALRGLISSSRPPLMHLDLSGNPSIGMNGGAILQESMEEGNPPMFLDLKLCGLNDELEREITEVVEAKYGLKP